MTSIINNRDAFVTELLISHQVKSLEKEDLKARIRKLPQEERKGICKGPMHDLTARQALHIQQVLEAQDVSTFTNAGKGSGLDPRRYRSGYVKKQIKKLNPPKTKENNLIAQLKSAQANYRPVKSESNELYKTIKIQNIHKKIEQCHFLLSIQNNNLQEALKSSLSTVILQDLKNFKIIEEQDINNQDKLKKSLNILLENYNTKLSATQQTRFDVTPEMASGKRAEVFSLKLQIKEMKRQLQQIKNHYPKFDPAKSEELRARIDQCEQVIARGNLSQNLIFSMQQTLGSTLDTLIENECLKLKHTKLEQAIDNDVYSHFYRSMISKIQTFCDKTTLNDYIKKTIANLPDNPSQAFLNDLHFLQEAIEDERSTNYSILESIVQNKAAIFQERARATPQADSEDSVSSHEADDLVAVFNTPDTILIERAGGQEPILYGSTNDSNSETQALVRDMGRSPTPEPETQPSTLAHHPVETTYPHSATQITGRTPTAPPMPANAGPIRQLYTIFDNYIQATRQLWEDSSKLPSTTPSFNPNYTPPDSSQPSLYPSLQF